MDENGSMNFRNWGFLAPPSAALKNHLSLQLMSSMAEKPLFGRGICNDHNLNPSSVMASTNGGPFHHHRVGGISESHIPMDYWMNHSRDKYPSILSGNHAYYPLSYEVSPETSSALSIQMPQQINLPKNENMVSQKDEVCEERDNCINDVELVKKRGGFAHALGILSSVIGGDAVGGSLLAVDGLVDVSLAYEHEEAWCEDCWTKDEYWSFQEGVGETFIRRSSICPEKSRDFISSAVEKNTADTDHLRTYFVPFRLFQLVYGLVKSSHVP
ncbi:hypothetical protein DH2020_018907 [Rehmannia glutinosa]|uniref:GAGA-binding transcriptional activator n=1 Tax=Rehmannia glutinosa TaxID=99300 RepID=A0ABR0WLG0_REHGL